MTHIPTSVPRPPIHYDAQPDPRLAQQTIEILRLLGRVECTRANYIQSLLFPSAHPSTMTRHLRTLWQQGLIWRCNAPAVSHGRTTPPLRQPYVYGLTEEGRTLLTTWGADDPLTLERLQTRDLSARPLDHQTLNHQLLVAWYCHQVIDALRHCPRCTALFIQMNYASGCDSHGRVCQRIDALIVIRLQVQAAPQHYTSLPHDLATLWPNGTPARPGEYDIRLAIEADTGTEPALVIFNKALEYRDLFLDSVYVKAIGGPVLPVFLAPSPQRADTLAWEWQQAWPGGLGVVAAPATTAVHPSDGILWGAYRSLLTGAPTSILQSLSQDARGHHTLAYAVQREEWRTWQKQR